VAKVIGFEGSIQFDTSKPDGTPRKLMDSSHMFALGWKPQVNLEQGIALAYADFIQNRTTNIAS
jgi:GDP-L-fucose synthase